MPLIRKPAAPPAAQAAPAVDPLAGLAHPSSQVRWAAARIAADAPGGVEALSRALGAETDARVREAILTSLMRCKSPACVDAIVREIRHDDAGRRAAALDAMRAMPDAVAACAPALLRDPDSDVRLLACDLARLMPVQDATRLMCERLERDEHANVCAAALETLTEIGGPEAFASMEVCAARFSHDPFLGFALKAAARRMAPAGERP
ncbi:MAG: repeat-containing lyase [Hyphomicrobiales bacterium]|nr:repeat-containing lyase [Hyphomicrobiales bacterium]